MLATQHASVFLTQSDHLSSNFCYIQNAIGPRSAICADSSLAMWTETHACISSLEVDARLCTMPSVEQSWKSLCLYIIISVKHKMNEQWPFWKTEDDDITSMPCTLWLCNLVEKFERVNFINSTICLGSTWLWVTMTGVSELVHTTVSSCHMAALPAGRVSGCISSSGWSNIYGFSSCRFCQEWSSQLPLRNSNQLKVMLNCEKEVQVASQMRVIKLTSSLQREDNVDKDQCNSRCWVFCTRSSVALPLSLPMRTDILKEWSAFARALKPSKLPR